MIFSLLVARHQKQTFIGNFEAVWAAQVPLISKMKVSRKFGRYHEHPGQLS